MVSFLIGVGNGEKLVSVQMQWWDKSFQARKNLPLEKNIKKKFKTGIYNSPLDDWSCITTIIWCYLSFICGNVEAYSKIQFGFKWSVILSLRSFLQIPGFYRRIIVHQFRKMVEWKTRNNIPTTAWQCL